VEGHGRSLADLRELNMTENVWIPYGEHVLRKLSNENDRARRTVGTDSDWTEGVTVAELINWLADYPHDMPVVIRRGIGWSGSSNHDPEVSGTAWVVFGNDDYDDCRKEIRKKVSDGSIERSEDHQLVLVIHGGDIGDTVFVNDW